MLGTRTDVWRNIEYDVIFVKDSRGWSDLYVTSEL